MYEQWITIRNKFIGSMYKHILKPFFFKRDPEVVHDRMIRTGKLLGRCALGRKIVMWLFFYQHPMLHVQWKNLELQNPVGLAAGFDKNAELIDILPSVGFGFAEVGSVTGVMCEGNAKPRLWRVPEKESLLVYYGLKNDGCEAIAERLSRKKFQIPIGISVAKTNSAATVETEAGIQDYVAVYKAFQTRGIGNYFTINISCPNTFGGEPFTDPVKLELLLEALSKEEKTKPVFLKISPDVPLSDIDINIEIAKKYHVDGFVCSNLTKKRDQLSDDEKNILPNYGGLSGKSVENKANELISHVYQKTNGSMFIIGVGGVFTAEDAYEKIRRGANAVQLITGMIYRGPQVISEINQGLVRLMKRDGHGSIAEVVGSFYK